MTINDVRYAVLRDKNTNDFDCWEVNNYIDKNDWKLVDVNRPRGNVKNGVMSVYEYKMK